MVFLEGWSEAVLFSPEKLLEKLLLVNWSQETVSAPGGMKALVLKGESGQHYKLSTTKR